MLKTIDKITNIGIFENLVYQTGDEEFKHTNLIYGVNGCGKTTFTNALRLLSKDLDEEIKKVIYQKIKNKDESDIEIELGFESGKLKYPNWGKNFRIFNSHFVNEHIYQGDKAFISSFKDGIITEESLSDPKIKAVVDKIDKFKAKDELLVGQLKKLEDISNRINVKLSEQWNASIEGKRLPQGLKINTEKPNEVPEQAPETAFDKISEVLKDQFRKFKISKNNQELQEDLISIDGIQFRTIQINAKPKETLETDISVDSIEKTKRKLEKYKNSQLKYVSVQNWFEEGVTLLNDSLEEKKCPLCNSSIPNIDSIISDYKSFYNEDLRILQKKLNDLKEELENNLLEIERIQKNYTSTKLFLIKYDLRNKAFPDDLKKFYDFNVDIIVDRITTCLNKTKDKINDASLKFDEKEMEPISKLKDDIALLNQDIICLISIKKTIERELKESNYNDGIAKTHAKDYFWKSFDIEGGKIATEFYKDLDEPKKASGLNFFHELIKSSKEIEKEIEVTNQEKASLLAQLKKEAKFVNIFLKKLCVSNFEIHITNDKEENIEIIYNGGRTKKGISYTLSEGEKTTLAFAYFLSKIKFEIIENTAENLNEYIVVIDDPVSSLDENRLFSTALIIRDYFSKNTKQLIVLSHNLVFLKFLGNILNKSPEERSDLLIEDGKIKRLPVPLTNYQTSYFYKLTKIQDFLDGNIEYESAKDFLPNNIRTVIETFLSFKFCRLKEGSGKQKFRSAGLDKLIATLDGIDFSGYKTHGSITSKDDLKNILSEIKSKVDPESHGTPQDLSDFEFMLEKELRLLASQTIEVIGYLDQLHLNEIKR